MIKKILQLGILVSIFSSANAADLWCGDYVKRVQIENGLYLVFLKGAAVESTHSLGQIGDPQADARYAMALSSMVTGMKTVFKYSNVSSSNCQDMLWETSKIRYMTQMTE